MSAHKTERAIDLAAAITGLNGIFTVMVGVLSMGGQPLVAGVGGWGLIGGAIQLGLAYGMFRRSRICATVTLVIVIIGLFVAGSMRASEISIIVGVVWVILLIRGTIGTFKYHKGKPDFGGQGTYAQGKHDRLKVRCPSCSRVLRGATREMIGEIGVCPKCGAEFTIGAGAATEGTEEAEVS